MELFKKEHIGKVKHPFIPKNGRVMCDVYIIRPLNWYERIFRKILIKGRKIIQKMRGI